MNFRKFAIKYIPLIIIAIMIIVLAVINTSSALTTEDFYDKYPNDTKTTFVIKSVIKTLPTLITLIVQLLLVSANRNAFWLGGCNAALYGVAYILDGVYFSAISAIAISTPIQLISYFTWKKNSTGKKVEFKKMSLSGLIATLAIIFACWAVCYFGLARFFEGGSYPVLDALTFAIGTVVTVIVAMRYIESQYLNAISCVIGLVMWILITINNPTSINQVIITVYNLFRVVEAALSWTKQYIDQKKDSAQNENSSDTPVAAEHK